MEVVCFALYVPLLGSTRGSASEIEVASTTNITGKFSPILFRWGVLHTNITGKFLPISFTWGNSTLQRTGFLIVQFCEDWGVFFTPILLVNFSPYRFWEGTSQH